MKQSIQDAIDGAPAVPAKKHKSGTAKRTKGPAAGKKRGLAPGVGPAGPARVIGPDGHAVRGPEQVELAKQNRRAAKGYPVAKRPAAGWNAREVAELAGFDPLGISFDVVVRGFLPAIVMPAKLAADGTVIEPSYVIPSKPVSDEERLKTLRDLLQYMVPKLSAVQLTGKNGGPVAVASVDVTELMRDPALAEAAQLIALGIASQQPRQIAGSPHTGQETVTYEEPQDDQSD